MEIVAALLKCYEIWLNSITVKRLLAATVCSQEHWQQVEGQIHPLIRQVFALHHGLGRYQRRRLSNHCEMWQECWFAGISESFEHRSSAHIPSRMCSSTRRSSGEPIFIHEKLFGWAGNLCFAVMARTKSWSFRNWKHLADSEGEDTWKKSW